MRLSISTKIFLGFVVVLLAFGGAALYGAHAVHTLGQQLRLVALGYSTLRLELQDQQTIQANLRRRLSDPRPAHRQEIAADRKLRRLRLLGAERRVAELRRSLGAEDANFLDSVHQRLRQLGQIYAGSEPLFAEIEASPGEAPEVRGLLRQREDEAARILEQLSFEVNNRVIEVVGASQRYEARAVWMSLSLAVLATGIGVLVMLLVQATLRPLRRLAEGARAVARGNYRQRVQADSPDEVGDLGREFNAMAAALEEREQRLRRSEQLAAIGKMAAQIAHEVRNPLSSIGLNAELLADEVDEGGEAQALSQAIIKEVDRLTKITEQYLRLARLPEPRFAPGDVSAVVHDLLGFLAGELSGRGVAVTADLDPGLPPVRLDENQLRQALLNLLRNAAEAMAELPPERRRLTVRTGRAQQGGQPLVTIEVADEGPGIAPEHRARIFEPFFTTKQGGTGLGLALAHEVVLRHGGTLSVDCPPEGGTRFLLQLPVRMGPTGADAPEGGVDGRVEGEIAP